MFLSQLVLNPGSRAVQRDLGSPYEMHRTLMRAFGEGLIRTGDAAERILYRLETDERRAPVVLVQSVVQPEWDRLDAAYLASAAQSKPVLLEPSSGAIYGFRLRANPTVRKQFTDGTSKRIGLYTQEEQIAWLARKLDAGGFRLQHVFPTREETLRGTIVRSEARHALKLLGVQFDGILTVLDSARAAETIARGIGSGKAFGFGLLSLARR